MKLSVFWGLREWNSPYSKCTYVESGERSSLYWEGQEARKKLSVPGGSAGSNFPYSEFQGSKTLQTQMFRVRNIAITRRRKEWNSSFSLSAGSEQLLRVVRRQLKWNTASNTTYKIDNPAVFFYNFTPFVFIFALSPAEFEEMGMICFYWKLQISSPFL